MIRKHREEIKDLCPMRKINKTNIHNLSSEALLTSDEESVLLDLYVRNMDFGIAADFHGYNRTQFYRYVDRIVGKLNSI